MCRKNSSVSFVGASRYLGQKMSHPTSVIKRYRCTRAPAPCVQYAQLRRCVSKPFRPLTPRTVDFLIAPTTQSNIELISVWPIKSNRPPGFKVRYGSKTIMVSVSHEYFIKMDTHWSRMTHSRNVFPISRFPV